jgi:hypothetical protein
MESPRLPFPGKGRERKFREVKALDSGRREGEVKGKGLVIIRGDPFKEKTTDN